MLPLGLLLLHFSHTGSVCSKKNNTLLAAPPKHTHTHEHPSARGHSWSSTPPPPPASPAWSNNNKTHTLHSARERRRTHQRKTTTVPNDTARATEQPKSAPKAKPSKVENTCGDGARPIGLGWRWGGRDGWIWDFRLGDCGWIF